MRLPLVEKLETIVRSHQYMNENLEKRHPARQTNKVILRGYSISMI